MANAALEMTCRIRNPSEVEWLAYETEPQMMFYFLTHSYVLRLSE